MKIWLSTCRYTVATRMTPELRWAAMRAISIFHSVVKDKVMWCATLLFKYRMQKNFIINNKCIKLKFAEWVTSQFPPLFEKKWKKMGKLDKST